MKPPNNRHETAKYNHFGGKTDEIRLKLAFY